MAPGASPARRPFALTAAPVSLHPSPRLGAESAVAAGARSGFLASQPDVWEWRLRTYSAHCAWAGRVRALRARWLQVATVPCSNWTEPPPHRRLTTRKRQPAARRVPWPAACHPRSALAHLLAACGHLARLPTPRRSRSRRRTPRPASHPNREEPRQPRCPETASSAEKPSDRPGPLRDLGLAGVPPVPSPAPIHRCHPWVLHGRRTPCRPVREETRRELAFPDAVRTALC